MQSDKARSPLLPHVVVLSWDELLVLKTGQKHFSARNGAVYRQATTYLREGTETDPGFVIRVKNYL